MRKLTKTDTTHLITAIHQIATERQGILAVPDKAAVWEELFMWLCSEEIILMEDVKPLMIWREAQQLGRPLVCGIQISDKKDILTTKDE